MAVATGLDCNWLMQLPLDVLEAIILETIPFTENLSFQRQATAINFALTGDKKLIPQQPRKAFKPVKKSKKKVDSKWLEYFCQVSLQTRTG